VLIVQALNSFPRLRANGVGNGQYRYRRRAFQHGDGGLSALGGSIDRALQRCVEARAAFAKQRWAA